MTRTARIGLAAALWLGGALSLILASVRDDWRLKKPKREPRPGGLLTIVAGLAAARKRTLDAVKLAHANAPFERGADCWDFNFDSAALCAT